MEAEYWQALNDKVIQCLLCPHLCLIRPGKTGNCRVRENQDGVMNLPYYGHLSAIAIDPMEKKPLYHFYPGSTILSVGFWGCNFHCPFCQNYQISQTASLDGQKITPEGLVKMTKDKGAFAIAYTYSEPLVHFEFIKDCTRIAREEGIKNVLVSNGFINKKPEQELIEYMDAANIDLKGFTDDFYKNELRGKLEPVKDFIKTAARKIILEVTTLVIPGKNDSDSEIEEIARFLGEIDDQIPYHLSCYYPVYKYGIASTSVIKIGHLAQLCRKYLKYVYPGNIGFVETNTYCPECNNLWIKRMSYHVEIKGILNGKCTQCGRKTYIPGI